MQSAIYYMNSRRKEKKNNVNVIHIQGVPGGMDNTSGECSLC